MGSSFCMFLVTFAVIFNPIFGLRSCKFPAILNFGDSNSDTGGLPAAFFPPNPPYGQTYFHMPSGRYSDGRVIIDFVAQSFNLPYLSAYLNSLGTSFSHGANFATGASTIRLPFSIIPSGSSSPFFLDIQLLQFMQFKNRSQIIRKQGGVFAKLMPKKEYFPNALYTFDIGQNDLQAGLLQNMSFEEVKASVPDIINKFSITIKNITRLGGRSFWIHNTGPIGCLPYILTNFPLAERDGAGCAKEFNEVAQYFNFKLKETVAQLREDFPSAAFTYVDIYSAKYSLISEAENYGFELPLVACCGYGGKYNNSNTARCGSPAIINGTQILINQPCDRLSARVNWDGVHYTEAANKFIFNQISTGAFSDPPIPLNKACHRTTF
ncbi:Esterase precursor, putative [Ricinus communis]|uniref:Esterase, putative n=2 Tax=Ricinus communis TaxID=3988 RepID=B9RJ91_RICCO|nr:Esterase precursor, putative [Ricinus communis]|eukprot:XP_002513810.1 esterase isoform X1 [Ricinus communis]